MIFHTKFCARITSKVEYLYVDNIESIIQEIYLIQQHWEFMGVVCVTINFR